MARPRGWIDDWHPQAETRRLIEQIKAVLVEYADYLPLTLRQIFYRLVGAHDFPKDERAYKRLCETAGKARRASEIPMDAIRDDGLTRLGGRGWGSKASLIYSWRDEAKNFRMNRQAGQPVQLYLWCEATGMAPQLETVADLYDVPVLSSGGFDSLTAKHDLANELCKQGDVEVLHIGDHDPSGVHIFSSLAEDIKAFIPTYNAGEIRFTRLVVTPDQIEQYSLPRAPAKLTDNRSFDGLTTQAESLPPDVLARIVDSALADRTDPVVRAAVMEREIVIQAELMAMLDRMGGT